MNNKVKFYRLEKNLSQEELAEKSKVSRTTISDLENEKDINITKGTMKKLAEDGLGRSISDVFFSV